MDQSRHTGAELRLHRHHKAAIPLGDNGLLEHLAVTLGGDDFLENRPPLGGGVPFVAADIRKLGAGVVRDLVFVQNGGGDPLLQMVVSPQGAEEVVDCRSLAAGIVVVVPDPAGAAQHPRNVQQFPCVQRTAAVRPVQALCHGLDARKGRTAPQADHGPCRVRLILEAGDILQVRLWDCFQRTLLRFAAAGLVRQHPQYSGQLQGVDGFIK